MPKTIGQPAPPDPTPPPDPVRPPDRVPSSGSAATPVLSSGASAAAAPAPAGPRLLACAVVVLAFLLPAAALIALGVRGGTQFGDQQQYHLPTIELFGRQWPAFDFRTYPAAMTPGYHLLMAAVGRAGGGTLAMQAATAMVTAGLLATLAWAVARRAAPADAVLLCLPVAWSQYVLTSGVFLVPHNLAWWGVLAILLLALRSRPGRWVYPAFGLALLGLLMARQIHLWALLPMAVAAAWGDGPSPKAALPNNRSAGGRSDRRAARLGFLLLAAAPGLLALGWFAWLWGGLTPATEEWVHPVRGVNGAAVAMMLATAGFLGVGYVALPLASAPAAARRWGVAGAVVAAAAAAVPSSSYDVPAGRWGGLWNLARVTPTVADRSLAVIALAAVGGFVVAALLAALRPRDRWVMAAALAGFVAAHATVNQAWQRYYEPMALFAFVLGCARLPAGVGPAATVAPTAGDVPPGAAIGWVRTRWPLVALAAIQAVLAAVSLR